MSNFELVYFLNGYVIILYMKDFSCRKNPKRAYARNLLFVKQDGKCFYCKEVCTQNKTASNDYERNHWFVLDHILPVAHGGSELFSNFVGSCWLCNARKGRTKDWKYTPINTTL